MQYKFTLDNEIEGIYSIDNPDGWKDIRVKLERHPEFHSLVEQIEVPLIFYGSNGIVDGGYDYIKNVEINQGINAIISILIEISEDEGDNWEELFRGNLELSDLEEFSEGDKFYKLKCPIVQTDLWSRFINRIETPVDLQSTTNLDGEEVSVIEPIELNLIGQKINVEYNGQLSPGRAFHESEISENDYIQIDFGDIKILDEVSEKFIIPISVTTDPAPLMQMKYAGLYDFDIRVEMSISTHDPKTTFPAFRDCSDIDYSIDPTSGSPASQVDVQMYFRKNNETPILFDRADFISESTAYTYSSTLNLNAGDSIYIYAKIVDLPSSTFESVDVVANLLIWGSDNSDVLMEIGTWAECPTCGPGGIQDCELSSMELGSHNFGTAPSQEVIPSYLRVTASTIYPDTTTDAILIHDVFKSIVERITGESNSFYSETFGGQIHGYDENGCNYKYAQMKGLHVRGFTFADKPFFQSFKDQWDGANPIFNLGLGYEDFDLNEGAGFTTGFSIGFDS